MNTTLRLYQLQSRVKRLSPNFSSTSNKTPGYMWIFEHLTDDPEVKLKIRQIMNGRTCPAWEPLLKSMEDAVHIAEETHKNS